MKGPEGKTSMPMMRMKTETSTAPESRGGEQRGQEETERERDSRERDEMKEERTAESEWSQSMGRADETIRVLCAHHVTCRTAKYSTVEQVLICTYIHIGIHIFTRTHTSDGHTHTHIQTKDTHTHTHARKPRTHTHTHANQTDTQLHTKQGHTHTHANQTHRCARCRGWSCFRCSWRMP